MNRPLIHSVMLACCAALIGTAAHVSAETAPQAIKVALVNYGNNQTTACFSGEFLTLVDRDSHLSVDRELATIDLDADSLFDHPMIVMAGDKAFTLTDPQARNLASFLSRGGFLLASASCANKPFDESFRRELKRVIPNGQLVELPAGHAIRSLLYQVERVITVKPSESPLMAVMIDGRVAVLYSPIGLNDSANMGKECCCCGANEIRNARQINANALVYAVTH